MLMGLGKKPKNHSLHVEISLEMIMKKIRNVDSDIIETVVEAMSMQQQDLFNEKGEIHEKIMKLVGKLNDALKIDISVK